MLIPYSVKIIIHSKVIIYRKKINTVKLKGYYRMYVSYVNSWNIIIFQQDFIHVYIVSRYVLASLRPVLILYEFQHVKFSAKRNENPFCTQMVSVPALYSRGLRFISWRKGHLSWLTISTFFSSFNQMPGKYLEVAISHSFQLIHRSSYLFDTNQSIS